MPFEKDPNELGVLWAKSSARGDYMTGSLEIDGVKHPIVVFRNGNKRNEKAPDFRILKATPREKLASTEDDSAPF
jgi:uncharacterized protein (DUF736 family)